MRALGGGQVSKYNYKFCFISPLLIQFQNVVHVSNKVFKILDIQEAMCHLPHHYDDAIFHKIVFEFPFKILPSFTWFFLSFLLVNSSLGTLL